jgi:hypothetical protein
MCLNAEDAEKRKVPLAILGVLCGYPVIVMATKINNATNRTQPKLVSRSAIQAVVDVIVQRFDPVTVMLFGSYATGKATATSICSSSCRLAMKSTKPSRFAITLTVNSHWT